MWIYLFGDHHSTHQHHADVKKWEPSQVVGENNLAIVNIHSNSFLTPENTHTRTQ